MAVSESTTTPDDRDRTPPRVLSRPEMLPSWVAYAVAGSDEPTAGDHWAAEEATLSPAAVPARREDFRLGRAAAHRALTDLGSDTGPILRRPDRSPIWPEGVVGSISHVSGLAVAIAAPGHRTDGVGIDIERRRHAPELHGQVPRPEESEWLDAAPAARRDDLVLALFSAKESIYKALHHRVGRFFGFAAASGRPVEGGFVFRMVEDLDPAYPPSRSFTVHVDWHDDLVRTWVILDGS